MWECPSASALFLTYYHAYQAERNEGTGDGRVHRPLGIDRRREGSRSDGLLPRNPYPQERQNAGSQKNHPNDGDQIDLHVILPTDSLPVAGDEL